MKSIKHVVFLLCGVVPAGRGVRYDQTSCVFREGELRRTLC
jgi:hypothetical protein